MKPWLLCLLLLPCRMAAAQTGPTQQLAPAIALPSLPEASLQAAVSTTHVSSAPGVRYQYQLVHLDDDSRIWLAPAWRGQTKLEPIRSIWAPRTGAADGLLMQVLNELGAEGWELIEIRAVTQPTQAVQKVERDLVLNDPNRPRYTGTTSIETNSQTRYFFRKALP